jgi:hypothetical protein
MNLTTALAQLYGSFTFRLASEVTATKLLSSPLFCNQPKNMFFSCQPGPNCW